MRVLVIFFLFVCFHLLSGYSTAGTGNHYSKAWRLQAQNGAETQGINLKGVRESVFLSGHRDLPAENEFPVFADADDDQEDIGLKRSIPLIESFSTRFFAFASCLSGSGLTNNLFFRGPPAYARSCKYILQRALRI